MDTPQLVSFMSSSVAVEIDSPDFWVSLDRLRTEYGMDTPQLVNFMSNRVAVQIDSRDFWVGLDRVRTRFGMDQLVNFIAIASRRGSTCQISFLGWAWIACGANMAWTRRIW